MPSKYTLIKENENLKRELLSQKAIAKETNELKNEVFKVLLTEHLVALEPKLPDIIDPKNPADLLSIYAWIDIIPKEIILDSFTPYIKCLLSKYSWKTIETHISTNLYEVYSIKRKKAITKLNKILAPHFKEAVH